MHCAIAFLGAFLLFHLELLAGQTLLPVYGGGYHVWTVCLVFFQGLLLGGYYYAHKAPQFFRKGGFPLFHAGLALCAWALMPMDFPQAVWNSHPALDLFLKLCWQLGLPFLLLSATATLVQRLYLSGRAESGDPYHLYAWSNLGSLAGLLGYPLALELLFSQEQNWFLWRVLFGLYVFLFGYLALKTRNSPDCSEENAEPQSASPRARLAWFLLPAASGALLITATNHLVLSTASIALLWTLPLALYLFSYIVYFWGDGRFGQRAFQIAAFMSVPIAAGAWFFVPPSASIGFACVVLLLLYSCLAYHGAFYEARPGPRLLSSYYLHGAAGGFIGTLLASLVLPFLANHFRSDISDFAVMALLGALGLDIIMARRSPVFRYRPLLVCAAAIVSSMFVLRPAGIVATARTFYGSYVVSDHPASGVRILTNGVVSHGEQYLGSKRKSEPLGYYGPLSPVGDLFAVRPPRVAAIVGLGSGGLCPYAAEGAVWAFFELDREVLNLARKHFTYLRDCRAKTAFLFGDARVRLQSAPHGMFDFILLDAFSSGIVPTHLLTDEAARLYADKLAPGGLLAAHVSNNFFDLFRILAPAFEARGLEVLFKCGSCPAEERGNYCNPSDWIAATADKKLAAALRARGWERYPRQASRVLWTDGRRNIFKALLCAGPRGVL